jgi:hypothetical protein
VENSAGPNGHGARKVWRVGDRFPDGRVVLEVDEHGFAMVVQRASAGPPDLTADGKAAVRRIVAAVRALNIGYTCDDAFRRRLGQRLVAGETEAAILATFERQARTLDECEAQPDPPDDPEERQALGLLGPRKPGPLAELDGR